MRQTYRMTISYDGTDYFGWQRQPQKKTIQGSLEQALFQITAERLPVIGAGRTDAGVHALGQVAHFEGNIQLTNDEFCRAINGHLPRDIRVTDLKRVSRSFHARKSALSKVYQYRIYCAKAINPFLLRYTLHWPSPLDIEKMKQGAALFIREADFTPFSSNRLLNPIRTITRSDLRQKGSEIVYTVQANGFLRYMVRSIVGTLLEVGKGKILPEKILDLFGETKRSRSSPTAPACGLCLLKVYYQPNENPIIRASSWGKR